MIKQQQNLPRERRKESKLKKFVSDNSGNLTAFCLSYSTGFGLAKVGKAFDQEFLPVILPAMDLFFGTTPNPGRMACYLAYGAGVATAYADRLSFYLSS